MDGLRCFTRARWADLTLKSPESSKGQNKESPAPPTDKLRLRIALAEASENTLRTREEFQQLPSFNISERTATNSVILDYYIDLATSDRFLWSPIYFFGGSVLFLLARCGSLPSFVGSPCVLLFLRLFQMRFMRVLGLRCCRHLLLRRASPPLAALG
ncbi:hypothetical protein CJ030_MR7G013474 [Morella rubra]|uniref:Uncharacterized protein n=1 Tax=Morella rubra TaxID=262757 RepID=A0A6A1V251_9ROSI|nr:hypothetical protein CJ030_MR7G013474 [Morella rubra]